MKLTLKTPMKSKSGMTLLELTVVILVLLSLISILFIGARAWKRGSDRAASILMIRNVQQAVRSHANMNALATGATVTGLNDALFGVGKFMANDPTAATYVHPAGTAYAFVVQTPDAIPDVGTLYIMTEGSDATDPAADAGDFNPTAGTYNDW